MQIVVAELKIKARFELHNDGSLTGSWEQIDEDGDEESVEAYLLSPNTLGVFKQHVDKLVYARLTKGIGCMIDASKRKKYRASYTYFSQHLPVINDCVSLDALEKTVKRADFEANFRDLRGGGPVLCEALIEYVPRLRSFLASK